MLKLDAQRIYLRELSEADATDKYVGWLNDPQVNRFLETRYMVQTLAMCQQFIRDMNGSEQQHLFGIFTQPGDEHIGNIKLGFIDRRYASGQVSLLIGERSMWGRGYASEAIKCITRYGFSDLELFRIEAGCYEENLGSLRAFLKCGYSVEGYFRKSVLVDGRRIGSFWLGLLKDECPYLNA